MTIGPAETSDLLLSAAESGGAGAAGVIVAGPLAGRRIVLARRPTGALSRHGTLGAARLDEAGFAHLVLEHICEWAGSPYH